jgi:hypothetical protein
MHECRQIDESTSTSNQKEAGMSEFSRRSLLGGVAAGSMLAAGTTTEALSHGQPPSGPTSAQLAGAALPSFRFALGAATPKTYDGGWLQAATVDQFPVSQKLAGALMQLARAACASCTGIPTRPNGPM